MEGGLEVFGDEEEWPDLRLEELKKLKLLKCDDMSRRPEQRERRGGGEWRTRAWRERGWRESESGSGSGSGSGQWQWAAVSREPSLRVGIGRRAVLYVSVRLWLFFIRSPKRLYASLLQAVSS